MTDRWEYTFQALSTLQTNSGMQRLIDGGAMKLGLDPHDLNLLGEDGWEVVGIVPLPNAKTPGPVGWALLKRPKETNGS